MERVSLARFSENIHGLKPQSDSFSSSLTYQTIEELLSLFSAASGSPRQPRWSPHYQSLSATPGESFSFLPKRKTNQAASSSVFSVYSFFYKSASVGLCVCSNRSIFPGYFQSELKAIPNQSLWETGSGFYTIKALVHSPQGFSDCRAVELHYC